MNGQRYELHLVIEHSATGVRLVCLKCRSALVDKQLPRNIPQSLRYAADILDAMMTHFACSAVALPPFAKNEDTAP